jgi:hypothetical protein
MSSEPFGRGWGTALRVTHDELKAMSAAVGAVFNYHPGLFDVLRRRVVDTPMAAGVSLKCADAAWLPEVTGAVLAGCADVDPLDSIEAAVNRPESMLRDVGQLTAGGTLVTTTSVTALRCDGPGCAETAPAAAPFAACSRCKMARYCSRACQAAGWLEHKRRCADLAATRRAQKAMRLSFDAPAPAARDAGAVADTGAARMAMARRVFLAAITTLTPELMLLGRAWYEALGRGAVVVVTTGLASFAYRDRAASRYLVVAYLTEAELSSDERRDAACDTALPGTPRPQGTLEYEALRAIMKRNAGRVSSYDPEGEVVLIGGDGMWESATTIVLPELSACGPVRDADSDMLAQVARLAYAHTHGNLLRESPSVLLYDMRGEQRFRRILMRWVDPAKPDPSVVVGGVSVPGVGDLRITEPRATPELAMKALDLTFVALAAAGGGGGGGNGTGKRGGKGKDGAEGAGRGGAGGDTGAGDTGAGGAGAGGAAAGAASGADEADSIADDVVVGDVD